MKLNDNIINLPTPEDSLHPVTRALIEAGSDKFHRHRYDIAYAHLLADIRQDANIFEIGVYKGFSHNAWRKLRPDAWMTGLDIKRRPPTLHESVRHYQGDQGDREMVERICEERGPFDFIIDDGSHTMRHQKDCYVWLWPHLTVGGWYVCEDLHTSELIERNDDMRKRFNPDGEEQTAMDFFLDDARQRSRRRGERDDETGKSTLYPDRMHLFFTAMVAIKKLHDGAVKVWP